MVTDASAMSSLASFAYGDVGSSDEDGGWRAVVYINIYSN